MRRRCSTPGRRDLRKSTLRCFAHCRTHMANPILRIAQCCALHACRLEIIRRLVISHPQYYSETATLQAAASYHGRVGWALITAKDQCLGWRSTKLRPVCSRGPSQLDGVLSDWPLPHPLQTATLPRALCVPRCVTFPKIKSSQQKLPEALAGILPASPAFRSL